MTYRLYIPGPPATKGSTRSIVHNKTGKIVTLPANKRLRMFEAIVAGAAAEAIPAPLVGAVAVQVVFEFRRPRSHYRANGRLRPDAPEPEACCKRKDIDKMTRAVLDGLEAGGVFSMDDSQVAICCCWKRWAEADGTLIEISQASDTETGKRPETPAAARTASDQPGATPGGVESRHGAGRGLLGHSGSGRDAG